MSQLGNTNCLSQPYSAWLSMQHGSGPCVILSTLSVLDALTNTPHLSFVFPLLVFSLSFLFVCIAPSIAVWVLLLAMCSLTDGPLFAVWTYLSERWRGCCAPPCGRAEAGSALGHTLAWRRCLWTGDILDILRYDSMSQTQTLDYCWGV